MTYLRTKPKYCPTVEATERGWVNSTTGELLVSLRNLKSLLAAEEAVIQAPVQEPQEVIMQPVQEEVVPTFTEVQVPLKEETVEKPKKKQKLLGEVVEFPIDSEVIGE